MSAYVSEVAYMQVEDCCSAEGIQRLHVSFESGGGGHFVVLSTPRWACSTDELRSMLDDWEQNVQRADKECGEEEVLSPADPAP